MGKTRFGVEPRSWQLARLPRCFPELPLYLLPDSGPSSYWQTFPRRGDKAQERGSRPRPSHTVLQITLTGWGALPVYALVSVHMARCAMALVNTLEFTCTRICPHKKVRAHTQGGPHARLSGAGLTRDLPGAWTRRGAALCRAGAPPRRFLREAGGRAPHQFRPSIRAGQ